MGNDRPVNQQDAYCEEKDIQIVICDIYYEVISVPESKVLLFIMS